MSDTPKPPAIALFGVEDLLSANELLKERDALRSLLDRVYEQAGTPEGLRYGDPLTAELELLVYSWRAEKKGPKADVT